MCVFFGNQHSSAPPCLCFFLIFPRRSLITYERIQTLKRPTHGGTKIALYRRGMLSSEVEGQFAPLNNDPRLAPAYSRYASTEQ